MKIFPQDLSLPRRTACALASLILAAAVWLPAMHLLFRPAAATYQATPQNIPPLAQSLAARHLGLWEDPEKRSAEIAKMRASNAEWDFMGRTYLVLALVDM